MYLEDLFTNINIYSIIFILKENEDKQIQIIKNIIDLTKDEIMFLIDSKYQTVRYVGQLNKKNLYHGKGYIFEKFGSTSYVKIQGIFSKGRLNGNSIIQFDRYGSVYCVSNYINGKVQGMAQYFFPSENFYKAKTACILSTSKGKYEIASMFNYFHDTNQKKTCFLEYIGEINKKFEYHGSGKTFNKKNRCLYDGLFFKHKKRGKGVQYFYDTNGEDYKFAYNGNFLNSLWHGEGNITLSPQISQNEDNHCKFDYMVYHVYCSKGKIFKGDVWRYTKIYDNINRQTFVDEYESLIYEGEFKKKMIRDVDTDILYHGKGILYNEPIIYEGVFKNNILSGHVKVYEELFNDNSEDSHFVNTYDGNFKSNKRHGYAKSYDSIQNQYYLGFYKNDEKHGQGCLYNCQDGKIIFEGLFKKNNIWKKEYDSLREVNSIKISIEQGTFSKKNFTKSILQLYMEHMKIPFPTKISRQSLKKKIQLYQEIKKAIEFKNLEQFEKFENHQLKEYLESQMSIRKEFIFDRKDENINILLNGVIDPKSEAQYDLFGNEIVIKCLGNDGNIYDLESMRYLFKKNEMNQYVNIRMVYNEKNELEPLYPIMTNGTRLSSYQKL